MRAPERSLLYLYYLYSLFSPCNYPFIHIVLIHFLFQTPWYAVKVTKIMVSKTVNRPMFFFQKKRLKSIVCNGEKTFIDRGFKKKNLYRAE